MQRFCPLCDRAFVEGEAVLRCSGCEVMHHPGCWVKHGGCATQREHESSAVALAYGVGGGPPVSNPHPGEGTRVRIPRPGPLPPDEESGAEEPGDRTPVPLIQRGGREQREPSLNEPHHPSAASLTQGMIVDEEAVRRPRAPYNPEPAPPAGEQRRSRRRAPDGHHPQKPLPSVYRHHQVLRYWYIPAAVGLAVVLALGVIWLAEQLTGGDGGAEASPAAKNTPGASPAGDATSPATPAGKSTPAGENTARPTPTLTGGTSTKFRAGDTAVVVGTGDCLNVRVKAGLNNDAIVCLADGEQVTVTGGPEGKDGLQWWKVNTKSGEGWAAEDYLAKKP